MDNTPGPGITEEMTMPKIKGDAMNLLRADTDYTAEEYNAGGYFIGGLDGIMHIGNKEEAEAIAAALNLAKSLRKMKRRAELLHAELSEFIR
jgi:hypothetical protein